MPFDDPTMLDSVYCDDDFACICHEFNLSSQWPMNSVSGCLPSIDSFRPSPQPSVAIPQTTDISFSDTGIDGTSQKEFLYKLNPIIIQSAIEPDTSTIQTIDREPMTATSPMPVAESRSAKRRPPKKPTTGDAMMRRTSVAESSSSNANSDSGDSGCELEGVKQQQKPRRTKKNAIHLWQFMLALLDDSRYNPECVKWLNRADGVFRIVQSAEIARLWGIKKGNPKMTFEKMSRALRWNRDNGFLADVPKNCGYPKKLCFRFGALAEHWDGSSTIPIGKVIGVSGLPPTSESDLDICNQ